MPPHLQAADRPQCPPAAWRIDGTLCPSAETPANRYKKDEMPQSTPIYLLNDPDRPVQLGIGEANAGLYPMANGLSRLGTRFLGDPAAVDRVLERRGKLIDAETADELGLATFAPDDIDWEDELRIAVEERASFSPDALTGMEANLRFAGPETHRNQNLRTPVRLAELDLPATQRGRCKQRRAALLYGRPERPVFDWKPHVDACPNGPIQMTGNAYEQKIPNNVNLKDGQAACSARWRQWQPHYVDWWK